MDELKQRLERILATRRSRGVLPPSGAAAEALATLEKEWRTPPEELRVWFSAHAGQDRSLSIFPGVDERHLLSAQDALAARRFLEGEYPGRFHPEWLPLLANRGGDYLVYVPGSEAGSTIAAFYHDDPQMDFEEGGLEGLVGSWELALAEEQARAATFASLPGDLDALRGYTLALLAAAVPAADLLLELRKITQRPLGELKRALTEDGHFLLSLAFVTLTSLEQRTTAWLIFRKVINLLKGKGLAFQVVLAGKGDGKDSRQELNAEQTERIFEVLRS